MNTVIVGFESGGDAYEILNLGDNWGGSMNIWTTLGQKYGIVPDGRLPKSEEHFAAIKDLVNAPSLTDDEWYSLQTTIDGVVVPLSLMTTVADALEAFEPSTSNLVAQVAALRQAQSQGIRAVAIQQTTIGDSFWYVKDEERPYNIDSDTGHTVLSSRS